MTEGGPMLTTYTPRSMGLRSTREPGSAALEGSYGEARQALAEAAARLRSVAERLGDTHAPTEDATATPEGAAIREALEQLETAARDVDGAARGLRTGGAQRSGGATARRILEAQEQERARLAEDLHDGPAQGLSNAGLQVEVIDRAMRSDPERASRELDELRKLLARELERVRGFIHQLRPALDEAGGLEVALEELAETFRSEGAMDVRLDLQAPEEWLDLAARAAVLRIAQEALRNARKHAHAAIVEVRTFVRTGDGEVVPSAWVLEVRDDGRGFPEEPMPARGARRHFGLRFMRERARLVGATLEIETRSGEGTTVRLALDPREKRS
jgi:signal transduction histidine kinase